MTRLAGILAIQFGCFLSVANAQDVYFVCDSTRDALYRMIDNDFDGAIDPVNEVNVYYDDTSGGPDLSTPNHLLVYRDGLLLSDGGTLDAIFFLRDHNDDGDANDAGEITPFYDDSASGIDLSTPNSLAHSPDGGVFVADDGASVRAIIFLVDKNGDDDANDDGESTVFYDQTAQSPANPIADPESVAVSEQGDVFVGDSTQGTVFQLTDHNGDGDALDPNEAVEFYSGSNPAPLVDIEALQVDSSGGVYAIDEDSGTILYLVDGNGDGDALDPGEATVFVDGTATGALISDPNDILWAEDHLVIADGSLDALLRAADLDGDGAASASGEVTFIFEDGGNLLSAPSGVAFLPGTVAPPPTLTAATPASGSVGGGTLVVVNGSHLGGTFAVNFGARAATTFTVIDDATVEALTPPASQAGTVDVSLETPAGSATLVDAFEYISASGLVIGSLSPTRGAVSGGTDVEVSGSGWDAGSPVEVYFGGELAALREVSAVSISVQTPPHAAGLVDVEVRQRGEAAIAPDAFRYQTPFVRGDSNRNDVIHIGDAVFILNYLFIPSTSTSCPDALDIDDDNVVVTADALMLLNYLFLGGAPPQPPFPAPGLDPTPGGPGCDF